MSSYHAAEENSLYNFSENTQTNIILKSKNKEIDTQTFLDDICAWMDDHRDIIKNKYLPFSYLSVGLIPSQASAFMFGCFAGRAMEKNDIKVETEIVEIDKEIISERVKKDIKSQMNWLSGLLKKLNEEGKEEKKDDAI